MSEYINAHGMPAHYCLSNRINAAFLGIFPRGVMRIGGLSIAGPTSHAM